VFTGIIEEIGTLYAIERGFDSARLTIEAQKILEDIKVGDSIAVNGVCLTVCKYDIHRFGVDVMHETLARTNLGGLRKGDRVNLERAVRLGGRLGGHLVSGHIDGTGTIKEIKKYDIAILITIKAPSEVMRYVIKKGSIAVDGISLTVVNCNREDFQVSIIPHTVRETTLGGKKKGDTVNLEADLVGKYIEKLLKDSQNAGTGELQRGGLTEDLLTKYGFM